MGQKGKNRNMLLNIGDKKTRFLLSLAKTPLLFYPHYKYHLPLPTVLMIENTNHCNAECVMCPRDTLSRKIARRENPACKNLRNTACLYRDERLIAFS